LGIFKKRKVENDLFVAIVANLDSLALGLEAGLASLGGPGEVSDRDDEEGVAARENISLVILEVCNRWFTCHQQYQPKHYTTP
jgi:hypothetical protein